jgi:hypothetical protein
MSYRILYEEGLKKEVEKKEVGKRGGLINEYI